ncbi:MAG: RNA polymerase sigma factor [Eubacteriales bacterium]|nr:RNA polymerase sigma factor [Eubacteriales bacterium]
MFDHERESGEELFCLIHSSYYSLLSAAAKRKGIPYDEIDDMLQETFLSYYEHYPLTWPDYKVRAILLKILRNRCIDYWRKCENRDVSCMDPAEMPVYRYELNMIAGRDLAAVMVQKETYSKVMGILKSMKKEWAAVVLLYVIEGRPMDEVSSMLGISAAACRTRLMRARRYIREQMELAEAREFQAAAERMKKAPGTI